MKLTQLVLCATASAVGAPPAPQVGDVPGIAVGLALDDVAGLELERVFRAPFERFADAAGQTLLLYTIQDYVPGEHFDRQQTTIASMNRLHQRFAERGLYVIALIPCAPEECQALADEHRVAGPCAPFEKVGGKWAPLQELLGSHRLRSGVLLSPVLALRAELLARWDETTADEFLAAQLASPLAPPLWQWERGAHKAARDALAKGLPARALAALQPEAGTATLRDSLEQALLLDVRFLDDSFANGRYDLAQRIAERQKRTLAGSSHGARAAEVLQQLAKDPALRAQLAALEDVRDWQAEADHGLDLGLAKKLRRDVEKLLARLPDGYAKERATKLLEEIQRYEQKRCSGCAEHPEQCKC